MSRRLVPVFCTLALLAGGCGGGSGGSGSSLPNTPISPQGGSAQIKLVIPSGGSVSSHTRGPKFVSPAANGVTIAAGSHGGALRTTAFDISSVSTVCQLVGTARVCTLNVMVPTGSDDFTITLYDAAPSGGTIPMSAHVLGTSTATNVTVTAGVTPSIPVYVMGTIANIASGSPSLITIAADGTTHAGSIVLNPTDFANNPITAGANDPYSNPITVSIAETGGSGHVVLTLNGTPSGTSVNVTQSSQSIGVQYDGGGAPGYSASVTASATGVTPITLNFAPMYVTSTSPYFSNGILNFTGAGETATFQINEALGSNTYTATPVTVASCPNVGSVGAATGSGTTGSVTVTSSNVAAPLSAGCVFTVVDSAATASRNVAVTNTTTSGGVTIGGITEYSTPVNFPNHIVAGADGYLYVTASQDNTATPTTNTTVWTYTTAGVEGPWSNPLPANPVGTAIGPNGFLWFVANDGNSYTWNAQNPTASGTAAATGASELYAIALGPDGNMWAADSGSNAVFQLSATNGQFINSYSITASPTLIATCGLSLWLVSPNSGSSTLTQQMPGSNPIQFSIPGANVGPSGMICDKSGNLWIAENTENEIDEFDGASFTQYPIGQSSGPAGIALGPDGNIWFTEALTNSIGKFNVTTHAFSHFPIPTPSSNPSAITLGADGRMWFTETAVGKIGAVTP